MSIAKNKYLNLKTFFSDRKGAERTITLNTLTNHIANSNKGLVDFVMLWGASNKTASTQSDAESLLYLFHFLKRVEDIYQVKTNLTLIFTDTHAYLNGYSDSNYSRYIKDISYHIKKHSFKWVLSSLMCKDKIMASGYDTYPGFIDNIIANSMELFNTINLDEKNLGAVENFYKYALRHCNRIGKHESGLAFKNAEAAAKAYLYFAFFEKAVITKAFEGAAFITYMSREEEFALPDLPIIRLFSMKSGLRTRPWFSYTN